MREQIFEMEAINIELDKIDSLMDLLLDYFVESNPEITNVLYRYKTYGDLTFAIQGLLQQQKKELNTVINSFYATTQ